MKYILSLLLFLQILSVTAQTEVFHDISLLYGIKESEKWKFDSELEWKHLYGEEGWSRMSLDLYATREAGILSFMGGLKNNYTFDEDIVNFWEIRPWIGVELKNNLTERLLFRQELKGEFRNFFFNDNSYDFNFRTRYNIALEYPLEKIEEKEDWVLAGEIEWYFLRNEEINERFINSREYSILLSKEVYEEYLLTFGVRFEEYSNNLINENDKAISFVLLFEM
ncbi:DUF2490 domain-containing protein [Tenacibaculum sp. SG-28]|uniref:DUF2490 domain-containing protein n=1 Tax=Tenacibaculum sp. SG-28 TaxID=754426 RepID=UPI000CF48588|nr:DUF2490 domain-containing protein [Tenacibaculum sp. SG-28]PQJ22770.1 hypothetical protein BSU00_00135 [Tenacibaculum sp. SG-28]